jgi:hypothetical protein
MAVKRERLHLSRYQSVETYVDGWNGRAYIACSSNTSMLFRDVAELRRFLKLPKGIASREAFDSWIASLEAADQERVSKKAEPLTSEAPEVQMSSSLSQELLATGFGPECHDVDNENTKMVI